MTQKGERLAQNWTGRVVKAGGDFHFMRMIAFVAGMLGILSTPLAAGAAPALAFLRAEKTRLVDEQARQPVLLKGCNLGNWLMIEPWMLGGVLDATDQVTIIGTFKSRFGE